MQMLFANGNVIKNLSHAQTLGLISNMLEIRYIDHVKDYGRFVSAFTNDIFISIEKVYLGADGTGFELETFSRLKSSIQIDYDTKTTDGAGTEQINTFRFGSYIFNNPNAIIKLSGSNAFYEVDSVLADKP